MKLTPTLLCLVASGLPAQIKPTPASTAQLTQQAEPRIVRPMLNLQPQLKADLLPAGKTQGAFHLTGIVRKNRDVVLRWANDQGEMPTEGVRVFRQKVGDATWKDLTGRKPVGFLQGKTAEKRLDNLPEEERDRILAYPFANIQHDPATQLRVRELPAITPKGAPSRARDLSPEKALTQFRSLRAQGRLNRSDLRLMHLRADMDLGMAEILGLTFTDDPGKGQFRYKIQVTLPEGGMAEVICPKVIDTREPTVIPQPVSLSAASGNGEVLLNWDEAPSDAVAGYNVYRAESSGGPWKKLNTDPVKKVELELEDPELTLRRSKGVQEAMVRMLRPLPESARTTQKIVEAHRQALVQMESPASLPTLSAGASKAIKDAVATGRLRPGGRQAPKSLFTDSLRAGTGLVNEKTYQYKVTAVDIGGLELPLDTAPGVNGIPKDLEPPLVPGKPALKTERTAITELRAAQVERLKDVRLTALDAAVATKLPRASQPMTPFQAPAAGPAMSAAPLSGPQAPLAPSALNAMALNPALAGLSLKETKRQQLSRTAATLPVLALRKLADAVVLKSNPDGTVPPAALSWLPSPDGDLKGYEVHKAVGTGAFAKVADTVAPEWTDTDLAPGQLYRYAITSVDKLGNVSARSPEGRVEVVDTSLPGRLAVPNLAGQVVKEAPALIPARRFLRPVDRVFASGSLKAARANLTLAKASESLVADFQAPKAATAPKAILAPMAKVAVSDKAGAPKATLAKGFSAAPMAEFSPAKLAASVKPVFRNISRSFNPMLLAPSASKELHVALEWGKPVQGFPMDYVIQQAPQKMDLVSVARPAVAFQASLKVFEAFKASSTTLAPGALQAMNTPGAAAKPATLHTPAALQASGNPPPKGLMFQTSPALHAVAARGLVAPQGTGLRFAEARKDHMATLQVAAGPGLFSRVNDTPVSSERYVVTFPAEVAQYGGATFFFRVQAFTKEFGRTVEGPQGTPIEVRLPDIVPPPSPQPGAVDLQEGPGGRLQVALGWTQTKVRDFKGIVVDRQPLSYTLVEGEAKAGAPLGPAERITAEAVPGTSFKDTDAPAGYVRYTLRAVDQTGNVSDPQGHLDILIPGESTPDAPTNLSAAGPTLTWKPGADTAGFTVWRSFTGADGDWECISGILPANQTSFSLPAQGTLHLRVVGRSTTGMHGTPSATVVRTP